MRVPQLHALPSEYKPDRLVAAAELVTNALAGPAVGVQQDGFADLGRGELARPPDARIGHELGHGVAVDPERLGQLGGPLPCHVPLQHLGLILGTQPALDLPRPSDLGFLGCLGQIPQTLQLFQKPGLVGIPP